MNDGIDGVVRIFDTTLRDGEQAPGINLNTAEKLQIARQLAQLKVDVIEAGFPAASPGDLEAVKAIASEVKGSVVAGLARTRKGDIDAAWEAVRSAEHPRIHVFIATSDIHMEHKLKMSRQQVLDEVRNAVAYAKSFTDDVEFSAEDASRSDPAFLIQVFKVAAECGATTLNIPDTVGYAIPQEFAAFVKEIIDGVGTPPGVIWSVHCHNDLGLAVANSLAAVQSGVRQVEGTINGLGERAGNASLEEVIMALKTRRDRFGLSTNIDTTKLYGVSRLVSRLTGVAVPPNKAVVGDNAFSHEAGIHQHGILCNRATYEIMKPEDVGAPGTRLVLGKHSGHHAFRQRLEELGYSLSEEELRKAFAVFKELCDRKEVVTDGDLEALVVDEILGKTANHDYELRHFEVHVGSRGATATVTLWDGEQERYDAATGNGPINAAYSAIRRITGLSPELVSFRLQAVSEHSDALGEAVVVLKDGESTAQGRGASTDVIEASIKAYVNALNRLRHRAAQKEVVVR
ncbi:MAG: 2-isopropylmalate synthase [Thermoleophilia bacterium]|jgi:2-isopropylmalate synthase|nr:2-isopropylmalate synthase [Thermoleophilia bacterium]